MQFKFTILLLTACVLLFTQVQAACNCSPSDTSCLNKCVTDGQNCVSACKSNACYNDCIAEHWPGQADSKTTSTRATSTRATSSRAVTTTSADATATVSTSSSAPTSTDSTAIPSAASSIVSSANSVASSAASAASSIASEAASSVASVISSASSAASAAITSAASFTPTPPTSSVAPSQTSGSNKSFLVPAVAIGVAMVTVSMQFFFLARMGSALFR